MLLIALVLITLVLVALEVILPGGILGVGAFVSLLLATFLCYWEYGFLSALAVFFMTALAALVLGVVQFRWWRKSALGQPFFLRKIAGKKRPADPVCDEMIGRAAQTLTRLNPSGMVSVDGRKFEAYSRDGYVEAFTPVRVVGRDAFKLIIEKP